MTTDAGGLERHRHQHSLEQNEGDRISRSDLSYRLWSPEVFE